jgi:5-methylcytosine-specific restriction endonuclease McrA
MPTTLPEQELISGLPAQEVFRRAKEARSAFGRASRALLFWIQQVEERRLYRELGYSSAFAYAEAELELDPHTIAEMLRTARCLKDLSRLAQAAARIAPSKLREISRVCVPATEAFWIQMAGSRTYREIEKMVAITPRGGLPPVVRGSGIQPDANPHIPSEAGLQIQTGKAAGKECGRRDRAAALRHLAESFLARSRKVEHESATPSAPFRIVIHEAPTHAVAWVEGPAGARFVSPEKVEEARCCGEMLDLRQGSAVDPLRPTRDEKTTPRDGDEEKCVPAEPRLKQAIPPSVRRMVYERDRGRCTVPTCTNRAWNHLHHIRPRSNPGSNHTPQNLTLLCSACHAAVHEGRLFVEGNAPESLVWRNARGKVLQGSSGAAPLLPAGCLARPVSGAKGSP